MIIKITLGSGPVYQLGEILVGDWIRLEGGVKIVLVTSIFDLVIWGVLATHNPVSHIVTIVLTATFWLKYEQISDLVFASRFKTYLPAHLHVRVVCCCVGSRLLIHRSN